MPDFHYLGKQGFPHAQNVNVYDYKNELDYSRYDYSQMSIQVCSVPWEQGEAHIGQRTLSGIGNVVYFESETARDEWFDAIPDTDCFRWETKFKELHSDLTLNIPLPFDIVSNYNYVRVTYSLFANDGSPLQYESDDGIRSWFYFIREYEFIAPNTTKLILLDDAWQTWIYSLDITNMILERGHAPMFATKADAYLANPIENCQNLLSEDINYGELQKVTKTQATTMNAGDMYAVVATSSLAWGTWGTKSGNDWQTPAGSHNSYAGVPNVALIAMDAASFNDFLDNITSNVPQFKQTVQCVFFCAKELLNVGDSFAFGGVTCYRVSSYVSVRKQVFNRTKADWGYADKYADLAKLYTFPYSALEITDEQGNTELVHIEDTANVLTMDVAANLVFPYLNLSGILHGVGGSSANTISFQSMNSHSLNVSGRWYEHLREWKIPGFSVILSAAREYDYSSHFDRMQMDNDRTTERGIANRSAAAQQGNTNNDADNVVNNAAAQTTANTAINSNSNSAASNDAIYVNALSQAIQAYDAGLTRTTVNNNKEAANATTGISAAGGLVNSAAGGAISGALSGGPVGAAIGAVSGLISGGISAATSLATNAVMTEASSANAEAGIGYSQSKVTATSSNNNSRTDIANSAKTANKNATNAAITTSANNTSSTMRENASRSYSTETQNATDNYTNAGNRISNLVKQAALRSPSVYGQVTNADYAATRPMALFVNIVTESDYAIHRAGDEFLRYGYYLDKQWAFDGNWLIGKHFTFWKLKDYWSTNQIPDRFNDQLRFLLFGGITVWGKPEDIGRVSIYDNGI